MTTTTSLAINASTWTQASTGSANVLIKGVGNQSFEVIVGTATPSPNSPASAGVTVTDIDGYSISLSGLTGTDNAYVRSCNPAGGTVEVIKS